MRIASLIMAASLAAAPLAAQADQQADADYLITIAGLEIGEIAVKFEEVGGSYALDFVGGFSFLFMKGAAEGRVTGEQAETGFVPDQYRLRFDGPTREVSSAIDFEEGRPKTWSIKPDPEPEWLEGRVALEEEHMLGAVDPVSAFLITANSPEEACSKQNKVFSGFVRFDIRLTPAAAEADGVIPCKVDYLPVSGHRVDSEGVARLRAGGGLKVSMAELAPGVWAPHFLGFRTPIGTLAFERK